MKCPDCGFEQAQVECLAEEHDPCRYQCLGCGCVVVLAVPLYQRTAAVPVPASVRDVFAKGLRPWRRRLTGIEVEHEIETLIGRVIVAYASAESELWESLPSASRRPSPSLTDDVRAWGKLIGKWRDWPLNERANREELRDSTDKCVKRLRESLKVAREDRHTLAHGKTYANVVRFVTYAPCYGDIVDIERQYLPPPFLIRRRNPGHRVELTVERLQSALDAVNNLQGNVTMLTAKKLLYWEKEVFE